MKKLFYVVLVVVVALFGLTFSYKNHQVIEVDYYFGLHFQGQLPLLLFITFALGLLAGYVTGVTPRAQRPPQVVESQVENRRRLANPFPARHLVRNGPADCGRQV